MQLWNKSLLIGGGGNSATPFDTITFNYTGSVQTFVVPKGNKQIRVRVEGAGGAGYLVRGGYGGLVICDLAVTPGEILYIYVGYSGSNSGGGAEGGGIPNYTYSGGSATDIRTVPGRDATSLASRLVVAGGGGGTGNYYENSGLVNLYAGGNSDAVGGNGVLAAKSVTVKASGTGTANGGGGGGCGGGTGTAGGRNYTDSIRCTNITINPTGGGAPGLGTNTSSDSVNGVAGKVIISFITNQ